MASARRQQWGWPGGGAAVVIAGRNARKAGSVVEDIRRVTGNRHLEALIADFFSLAQVRALADSTKIKEKRLFWISGS